MELYGEKHLGSTWKVYFLNPSSWSHCEPLLIPMENLSSKCVELPLKRLSLTNQFPMYKINHALHALPLVHWVGFFKLKIGLHDDVKRQISWKKFAFCVYLGLVPGFGLFTAPGCDILVLSLDFGHDMIHVEVSWVVHLHDDGRVFNACLQLTQFLIQRDRASLRVFEGVLALWKLHC